jgi:hypothetical protein
VTVPNQDTQNDSTGTVEEVTNAEVEQDQNPADEQPEGNEAEEQAEAGDEPKDDEGDDAWPESAKQKITKVQNEAKGLRTRLREAEEKLATAKSIEEVEQLASDLKAEREKAEQDAADEIRALLIENVALQYKLPAKLAKRLVGSTREEIEADAKELAAEFAEDDREIRLEGGLAPRNRDADAGLGPRELAGKHGSRKKRH